MNFISEWDNILHSLTEEECEWIRSHDKHPAVIQLFEFDDWVSTFCDGKPDETSVSYLLKAVNNIRNSIKAETDSV